MEGIFQTVVQLLLCLQFATDISGCPTLKLEPGDPADPTLFIEEGYKVTGVWELPLDPEEVEEADDLEIPSGMKLHRQGEPMVDGAYASHDFEGLHDTEADLTVNREAGTVYGRVVDSDGEVYLVRSDQEGKHYWIEADNSDAYDPNADDALEPDSLGLVEAPAELQSRLLDQQQIQAGFERAARDPYTVARISLKIYYTRRFRAITPDMKASLENTIAYTNQGFRNSGVKIQLYLLCTELYPGTEDEGSVPPRLKELIFTFGDWKGRSVPALLGSADATMLMVAHADYGGVAFIGDVSKPIGIANKQITESGTIFGHEVSHMLGAMHDRETLRRGGEGPPRRPYGVGYLMPGTEKRTIMAYPRQRNDPRPKHAKVVNFYSGNGLRTFDGIPTGDANHDNVRLLNERRFIWEMIGDESQPCYDNLSNNNNGNNNNNNNNGGNNNNGNYNNGNNNNNNGGNYNSGNNNNNGGNYNNGNNNNGGNDNNNNGGNYNNGNPVIATTAAPPSVPPCQDQNAFCSYFVSFCNSEQTKNSCRKTCNLC